MIKAKIKKEYLILIILIVSTFLNLWGISRGDPINDEVLTGFRAIKLVDFDEAAQQTTPWEWMDGHIPWWAHLSFHDHPPLVFWIEHFSISLFGENNFAMRLPSALLGITSVYLLYLLIRRLYSRRAGLMGAALYGVTLNHLYISRVGMQEAYVIFFILLARFPFPLFHIFPHLLFLL